MPNLTVAEYDTLEQEALSALPNRMVEAFQPVHFGRAGYPVHVRREPELWKYVDVMHELNFEKDFRDFFFDKLTQQEFILLQELSAKVASFAKSTYGILNAGKATVFKSLNVFRHIRYIFGDARPRVLEIGPGCGYLGAYLMMHGYPYASMDVAQAFYLYQNHLWNNITGEKVRELAATEKDFASFPCIPDGGGVHIPWWEFVRLTPQTIPFFDIVTCNHALCEMHPLSMGFVVKLAHAALSKSKDGIKVFMFEGWGAREVATICQVVKKLYRSGFALVFNDSLITMLVLSDRKEAFDHLVIPEHPDAVWELGPYFTLNNDLVKGMLLGRKAADINRTVTIDQVNQFYTDLLGTEDHLTADEKFMKFIVEK